jgi:hypothetical protein
MLRSPWSRAVCGAIVILFSWVAHAQQAQELRATGPSAALVPWRGSRMFYGHSFTALTLSPGAEPRYNPYYAHRFELLPEWHFGGSFFIRGRMEISQELTVSDTTRYVREVVFSDSYLQAGMSGLSVPCLGVRIWPSLRLTFPTSKLSHSRTLRVAISPGVTVSKGFNVLSGLSVSYATRYSERLHRFTTSQNEGSTLPACTDLRSFDCLSLMQTGQRNTARDVVHGPNFALQLHPRLWLNTGLLFSHGWRYGLAPVPAQLSSAQGITTAQDNGVVSATQFGLEAGFSLRPGLALAVGTSTLSMQPNPTTGRWQNPLFNRGTALYLDFGIDFESLFQG